MISKVAIVALFAGLAAAAVDAPMGNPISAPLTEIVPACKPYTITWTPTSTKKISILLLRGPSENVLPLGAPLAESIDNSGKFVWTPSADLEADTTHYGLKIVEENGQYQYSNQFGISKDDCEAAEPTVASTTKSTASATGKGYDEPKSTSAGAPSSSKYEEPSSTHKGGYQEPATTKIPVSSTVILSTGAPILNSTTLVGTKSLTIPASLKTTASSPANVPSSTTSGLPESTGAAAGVRAGLGLAGAVAGLVFML